MHRWIDHTAELELRIEAPSPEAVMREALEALSKLLGDADAGEDAVLERIELEAPDCPALLAEWLEELVFLSETRALVCERLEDITLEGSALRASVTARPGVVRHQVKAVTYHGLRFERSGDRWLAGAVLDV